MTINGSIDVADLVTPRGWVQRLLLVLGGYIDASNSHDDSDIVGIGGCLLQTDKWRIWEKKWKALLAYCHLERWHHTDFVNKLYKRPGRPTEIWRNAEWLVARRLLCESFEEVKPVWIGATLNRSDYQSLRPGHPNLPEDPYYFLLDRCLHILIQRVSEAPEDEGIAIYCDQDKDEALVLQLAKWHTDYLRKDDSAEPWLRDRPITTSYGSNIQYKPLQAADVVAHEAVRYARSNPTMPFVPTNRNLGGYIVDRLKNSCWVRLGFYQRWMIDTEMSGKAFPPDSSPAYRFNSNGFES